MRSHYFEKKSSKRKRTLDRTAPVHGSDAGAVRKLLGLK
jgi:ribosomal protein L35